MTLPPQKMREAVFQLLYSLDSGDSDLQDVLAFISKELAISKKYVVQAFEKVIRIRGELPAIDKEIAAVLQTYTFERIMSVEKNVLRLSTYEILFDEEVPPKVAIAEGIRLAKKFSTPESAVFVNAVLDAIYKRKQGVEVDTGLLKKSVEELKASQEVAEEAAKHSPVSKEEESNFE